MRLRGIPGSGNVAQAAHDSAARARREGAATVPAATIEKASGASRDAEGGKVPETAKKGSR